MASKKSTKTKHYPVVRKMELGSTTETLQRRLVDTASTLSRVNRRLYRYARCYSVNVHLDVASPGAVGVYVLRNDWAVHQGLKMAYKMYLKNTEDERKALGKNMVARWEDFRVESGIAPFEEMLPVLHDSGTLTPALLAQGEFAFSNVVDSTDTRRTFTWGIPTATQFGILQEYDKAANAQEAPADDFGVTGPYSGIDSHVKAGTTLDLVQDGDRPPYDRNGVAAGSPWVQVATLGIGPAGDQKLSSGFIDAPCGLVLLVGTPADWNSNDITFEVKKGDYKGVHAISMLE